MSFCASSEVVDPHLRYHVHIHDWTKGLLQEETCSIEIVGIAHPHFANQCIDNGRYS